MSDIDFSRASDWSIPITELTPAERNRRMVLVFAMLGAGWEELAQRTPGEWREARGEPEPPKPQKWGISNAAARGKSERRKRGKHR